MAIYEVGDVVDEAALAEYAALLRKAYQNGEERGGSMDWSDVQEAANKAVEALGPIARQFSEDAEEGFEEEPGVTYPLSGSVEVRSAAELLYAYRYPDDVNWEDVDQAYNTLVNPPPAHDNGPTP